MFFFILISSLDFLIFIYFFSETTNVSLIIFSIFVPMLTLITYQKNIERLLKGEEVRVKFK